MNQRGIDWLLKEAAKGDIERRTENIREEAGRGFNSETDVGRTRVRGAVWTYWTSAKIKEARDRALTRAIDAGRR